jgi:hypothetical protein
MALDPDGHTVRLALDLSIPLERRITEVTACAENRRGVFSETASVRVVLDAPDRAAFVLAVGADEAALRFARDSGDRYSAVRVERVGAALTLDEVASLRAGFLSEARAQDAVVVCADSGVDRVLLEALVGANELRARRRVLLVER